MRTCISSTIARLSLIIIISNRKGKSHVHRGSFFPPLCCLALSSRHWCGATPSMHTESSKYVPIYIWRFTTRHRTKVSPSPPNDPGFTIIKNAIDSVRDIIDGQSVILVAPSFRNGQSWKWACTPFSGGCFPNNYFGGYSSFLNNGMTDKGYWLQVGLYFTNRDDLQDRHNPHYGNPPKDVSGSHTVTQQDCPGMAMPGPVDPLNPEGAGWVVFAGAQTDINGTKGNALAARALCVPYVPGHHYYTTITYSSGTWWTCAADLQDTTTYRCQPHGGSALGTRLIDCGGRTNVFFENWNKEPNRPWGFPPQLVAYGARIYVNGSPRSWPGQLKSTQHMCKDKSWPPVEAIVESSGLVEDAQHDGYAYFNTNYVPAWCE